ncbi:hypothetical protein FRC17_003689 [Serendipita sp. 399]|nr:hypothetical protein FRC17_003689 [Serendipita sp. 399]
MVKGLNNGLATISSLLLGISVTAGLTEVTWDFVRRSQLTLEHLDAMLQLPSPLAFLATPSVVRRARYLVVISLISYSLTLVSILAPGSLSIRANVLAKFSTINLLSDAYWNINSTYPYNDTSSDSLYDPYYDPSLDRSELYYGPSALFQTKVTESISTNATSIANPPQKCGQHCNYLFRFNAPSISCIQEYSHIDNSSLKFPDIFQAYSNVKSSLHNPSPQEPLYLQLSWLNVQDDANITWTPLGRKFIASVLTQFYPLHNFYLPVATTASQPIGKHSITCGRSNYSHCNFVGFIEAFTALFQRNVSAWNNFNSDFGVLNHTFRINNTDSEITRFYLPDSDKCNDSRDASDCPLQIALANCLEAFLNLTRYIVTAPSQGASVYEYSAVYLWALYGTALAASTVVSLVAMILTCIHGIPSAIGFSHFLIMTQNPKLAQIGENAPLGAFQLGEDTRKITLRFGKLGARYDNGTEMVGFTVDDDEAVPLLKPKAEELW